MRAAEAWLIDRCKAVLIAIFGNAADPILAQDGWEANAQFSAAARTDVPTLASDVLALVDQVRQLRDENDRLHHALSHSDFDCPELDGTDFAHPAWWRGEEYSCRVFCHLVGRIIDGQDDCAGMATEPWESTRKRLFALVERMRELENKA